MKDVVGGEFPGDFRNDFIDFGWDAFDDETKFVKRSIEVNQGRAAMSVSIFLVLRIVDFAFAPCAHGAFSWLHRMGILALMVHEQLGVPIIP